MLNDATKKKINTARDILVGVVPVPTSQVEQITLALIYKFMSDLDKKAKDLGDTNGFFANGYEEYSWDHLMDKSLGARERVKLYREGLEKMSLNPHIPQLFRDIFKNAFLRFNNPETLKMFLDTIDQFEYEHSEDLGNAFEYLLQVMGSQGDAGQFRTPRHIIDFIVEVVEPKKTDKILDPACGTAGFLIAAYKYLRRNGLGSDEVKELSDNFVGYDISSDMQRLSLVNMYLHNFPDPHIYEYDTLTSEERWDDDFDVILANPPFMTPKGGIKPHSRFSVRSKRAEVLFVDYIMEHLTNRGKAGVIVPEGIIFQSQNAYKDLRKMMVDEKFLWAVVSLPSGVFQPYSGVKTSILLFDKEIAKKTNKILFVNVENDGFDLGAQRKSVEEDDLPVAKALLKQYKQAILAGEELDEDTVLELGGSTSDKEHLKSYGYELDANGQVELGKLARKAYNKVDKKELRDRDFSLNSDRYVKQKIDNAKYEYVKLSEVAVVNPSKTEVSDLPDDLKVSFVPMSDVKEDTMHFKPKEEKELGEVYDGYKYFKEGDILLAKITPCFENGKSALASGLMNDIGFGSTEFHVFRVNKSRLNEKFLYFILNDRKFKELAKDNMTGSAGQKRVPTSFVKNYKIPLPPIPVQKEIVAELDRYQKIIDGAKQVVDNYQPSFVIEDDWEWIELNKLCENLDSQRVPIRKSERKEGKYPYYGASGIIDYVDDFIFDEDLLLISEDGANLIARTYPIAFSINGKAWVNNHAHALRFKNMILQKYVEIYINQTDISDYVTGAAQPKLNQKNLNRIKIPLPDDETMTTIVSSVKNISSLVEANKSLLSLMENKIEERVSKIWNKK